MIRTTTAQPLTIPAAGLEHRSGNVVITATPTAQAGYRVQVRIAGIFNADLSSGHTYQTDALRAFVALVEQYPATLEPAPAVVAIPGNVGQHMRVSDPSHVVLALAATAPNGIVEQGGKLGQATRTQLRSLAKKGYLELIYEVRTDARKVPVGGRITALGRKRLAELTQADRDAAEHAARLAVVLNITASAPIAA